MKRKNNYLVHYILMGVLTLFFIILLLLSTSTQGLELSYSFEDEVSFNTANQRDVEIGTVNIINENSLPKKIKLNQYILCPVEKQEDSYSVIRVEYLNSREFSYSNGNSFITIPGNSETSQKMVVTYWNLNPVKDNLNNSLTEDIKYYLYEIEENLPYYRTDICNELNEEDSVKAITLSKNE